MNSKEKIEKAKEFIFDTMSSSSELDDYDFEKPHKPFFVISWWGHGAQGSFATKNDILKACNESLVANDDWFTMSIYDFEQDCSVMPIVETIKLKKEK